MGDQRANRMNDGSGITVGLRRAWPRAVLCVLAAGWLMLASPDPTRAQEPVDLELLLAIDASGSVDGREFDLQRQGIERAFSDPDVIAALAAYAPSGVAVGLMQWSGRRQQVMAVDWTLVRDAASAAAFGAAVGRVERWILGETAIADALAFAVDRLQGNRFAGARRVIDVSGDGATNAGGDPAPLRDAAVALGITINGLAIVNEAPVLDIYYAEHVVGGPGAFTMVAKDYVDFVDAIRRKLLREIEGAGLAGGGGGRTIFAMQPQGTGDPRRPGWLRALQPAPNR
jgi:Protein of unknown function (DUF1194)